MVYRTQLHSARVFPTGSELGRTSSISLLLAMEDASAFSDLRVSATRSRSSSRCSASHSLLDARRPAW